MQEKQQTEDEIYCKIAYLAECLGHPGDINEADRIKKDLGGEIGEKELYIIHPDYDMKQEFGITAVNYEGKGLKGVIVPEPRTTDYEAVFYN